MAFDPYKLMGFFSAVEGVIKFAESLRTIEVPNVPGQSYGDTNERVDALEKYAMDVGVYLNQVRDLEVPTLESTAAELTEVMYALDGELNRTREGNVQVIGADDVQVNESGIVITLPTPEVPDEGLNADEMVKVSSDDTTAGRLRLTAAELSDPDQESYHKIIGDAELDARNCAGNTRYWIQAVVIQEGADEQLKIEHVGPGPSCYCWCSQVGYECVTFTLAEDWDAKGHLRCKTITNNVYASPMVTFTIGPCA